ncbi:MAG: hypothetical protein PHQ18_00905 [Patescibacteria group bacterium]|nr:hypothetical protein [Patescibacteria group bacterium]
MKKNFFAKLGHFFLVSALLFNSFGVAFVSAEVDPTAVSFINAKASLPEGTFNGIEFSDACIVGALW